MAGGYLVATELLQSNAGLVPDLLCIDHTLTITTSCQQCRRALQFSHIWVFSLMRFLPKCF
jgi:hypothetical protein